MNTRDETALKQSFSRVAKWILRYHSSIAYIKGALQSRDLDKIVRAVKQWLDKPINNRWLLVYNNYDNPLLVNHKEKGLSHTSYIEPSLYSDKGGHLARAFDLYTFLPETDHVTIIVTTRSSIVKLGPTIHLSKLIDINDSLKILASVSSQGSLKQGKI